MEFNLTWQEARSQRPIPSFVFGANRKQSWLSWPLIGWESFDLMSSIKLLFLGWFGNQDGGLASDWLRHFQLICKIYTEFKETRQKATSSNTLCFVPVRKPRLTPWRLNGWDIFDFSSETAEQNLRKLDTKQDLNVLYQFVFSGWLKN